jgi:hypothetical protein
VFEERVGIYFYSETPVYDLKAGYRVNFNFLFYSPSISISENLRPAKLSLIRS